MVIDRKGTGGKKQNKTKQNKKKKKKRKIEGSWLHLLHAVMARRSILFALFDYLTQLMVAGPTGAHGAIVL